MTKKYKILTEFAKDVSYETPNVETYLQTKDNILKYNLNLDINSKFLKNKIIEVNIISKFQETNMEKKKSNFEITYTAIVRIDKSFTINDTTELYDCRDNDFGEISLSACNAIENAVWHGGDYDLTADCGDWNPFIHDLGSDGKSFSVNSSEFQSLLKLIDPFSK